MHEQTYGISPPHTTMPRIGKHTVYDRDQYFDPLTEEPVQASFSDEIPVTCSRCSGRKSDVPFRHDVSLCIQCAAAMYYFCPRLAVQHLPESAHPRTVTPNCFRHKEKSASTFVYSMVHDGMTIAHLIGLCAGCAACRTCGVKVSSSSSSSAYVYVSTEKGQIHELVCGVCIRSTQCACLGTPRCDFCKSRYSKTSVILKRRGSIPEERTLRICKECAVELVACVVSDTVDAGSWSSQDDMEYESPDE